jgi:metal-responsive CopG/Arc/MetJ family transcriptional regulator
MSENKTKATSLTLKADIIAMLDSLAKRERISRSLVVNKLLEKELKKYVNEEKSLFDM